MDLRYHASSVTHAFERARRKSGVTHATFHDLRYTLVTHARRWGVHCSRIMAITGRQVTAVFVRYRAVARA